MSLILDNVREDAAAIRDVSLTLEDRTRRQPVETAAAIRTFRTSRTIAATVRAPLNITVIHQ